jgi:hypothetical protein
MCRGTLRLTDDQDGLMVLVSSAMPAQLRSTLFDGLQAIIGMKRLRWTSSKESGEGYTYFSTNLTYYNRMSTLVSFISQPRRFFLNSDCPILFFCRVLMLLTMFILCCWKEVEWKMMAKVGKVRNLSKLIILSSYPVLQRT